MLDSCGSEPGELLRWLKLSLATFWQLVLVSVGSSRREKYAIYLLLFDLRVLYFGAIVRRVVEDSGREETLERFKIWIGGLRADHNRPDNLGGKPGVLG